MFVAHDTNPIEASPPRPPQPPAATFKVLSKARQSIVLVRASPTTRASDQTLALRHRTSAGITNVRKRPAEEAV